MTIYSQQKLIVNTQVIFLFVKFYLLSEFIELDIFKDLYQSLPGNRLQSHSIEPLLKYLGIDLFSILLVHAVYNSIYHVSMLVIQQKNTKFPIFVSDSRCNINTLMAWAVRRVFQQRRKSWLLCVVIYILLMQWHLWNSNLHLGNILPEWPVPTSGTCTSRTRTWK